MQSGDIRGIWVFEFDKKTAAGFAVCAATVMATAKPVQFAEVITKKVPVMAEVGETYPAFREFGGNFNGGVGVENSARHADWANRVEWLIFQTGNGGHLSGLHVDVGQNLALADGDSVRVDFILGVKKGEKYTAPVVVKLTDGLDGRPLASAEYARAS